MSLYDLAQEIGWTNALLLTGAGVALCALAFVVAIRRRP